MDITNCSGKNCELSGTRAQIIKAINRSRGDCAWSVAIVKQWVSLVLRLGVVCSPPSVAINVISAPVSLSPIPPIVFTVPFGIIVAISTGTSASVVIPAVSIFMSMPSWRVTLPFLDPPSRAVLVSRRSVFDFLLTMNHVITIALSRGIVLLPVLPPLLQVLNATPTTSVSI